MGRALECCSQPHRLEEGDREFGSEWWERGVVRAGTPDHLPASVQLGKRFEQVTGEHGLQLQQAELAFAGEG